MGNRAVVAFQGSGPGSQCVYVHWNGGRASIQAFLNVAKKVGAKTMQDFFKVTQAYLGSSAYLEKFASADKDNWDNGTYIINREWEIVDRMYKRGPDENSEIKTKVIYQDTLAAYYGYQTTDEDLAIFKKVATFLGNKLDGNTYYATLNV